MADHNLNVTIKRGAAARVSAATVKPNEITIDENNRLYTGNASGKLEAVKPHMPTDPAQYPVLNQNTTGSAAKLETERYMLTNLSSAEAKPFDGTANIEIGVTGLLDASHGGTGKTTLLASAKALGRAYSSCSSASNTVDKLASVIDFRLDIAAVVGVMFTYANTASNTTLNINGTGTKPIYDYRTYAPILPSALGACTHFFMYDGLCWVCLNPLNPTFTITLNPTNWSANAPYTQTVAVNGMVADLPIFVDLAYGSLRPGREDLQEAEFMKVKNITSANGSITAVCRNDKPTETLTLKINMG